MVLNLTASQKQMYFMHCSPTKVWGTGNACVGSPAQIFAKMLKSLGLFQQMTEGQL